jgi:hypothetical protein
MADLDPHSTDGAAVNSELAPANSETHRAAPLEANHCAGKASSGPDPAGSPTDSAADDRSGLDRAEEVVDHLAGKVSGLASSWGRKILRLGSRAREMLQDFWAEVQDFRQGKKS